MGRATVYGVALVILAAVACRGADRLPSESEAAKAPAPARHAVHSERIQALMGGLDRLQRGRLPQAMDLELERDRRIREVQNAARELASSARVLAELAPTLDLDSAERETFAAFARLLEQDARALAEAAPTLSAAAMHERAAEIRVDCDRCHERFRLGPVRRAP